MWDLGCLPAQRSLTMLRWPPHTRVSGWWEISRQAIFLLRELGEAGSCFYPRDVMISQATTHTMPCWALGLAPSIHPPCGHLARRCFCLFGSLPRLPLTTSPADPGPGNFPVGAPLRASGPGAGCSYHAETLVDFRPSCGWPAARRSPGQRRSCCIRPFSLRRAPRYSYGWESGPPEPVWEFRV